MGEAAEMILNGECCQYCGEFLFVDDPAGYPVSCAGCGGEEEQIKTTRSEGKKRRAKRRKQRLAKKKKERLMAANSEGWNKHTVYHWSKEVCGLRLDYWPSTQKAMCNGHVFKGVSNIDDLVMHLESGVIKL